MRSISKSLSKVCKILKNEIEAKRVKIFLTLNSDPETHEPIHLFFNHSRHYRIWYGYAGIFEPEAAGGRHSET
jgi:hypothetical protein